MATEVPLNKIVEEILLQEKVKIGIRISGIALEYTAPSVVPSYTEMFPNALEDDHPVKRLTKRINQLIPGVSFSIIDGHGRSHMGPLTRMGTLRASYSKTT